MQVGGEGRGFFKTTFFFPPGQLPSNYFTV